MASSPAAPTTSVRAPAEPMTVIAEEQAAMWRTKVERDWKHVRVLQTSQNYDAALTASGPVLILFTASWDKCGGLPWYESKLRPFYDLDDPVVRCCVDIEEPGMHAVCERHNVSKNNMPALLYFEGKQEIDRMEGAQLTMLTLFQGVDRNRYDKWLNGTLKKEPLTTS